MKFVSKSSDKRVGIIVSRLNEAIECYEFGMRLRNIRSFHPLYTSSVMVDGEYIWHRIRNDDSIIEVKTFRSRNPFTKSNGYTLRDNKLEMFLNTRKFNRSDASIAATIAHEGGHELDNNDPNYFYHHGDNKPKGGTVPEVLADIIYEIMSGVKSTQCSAIR